MSDSEDYMVDSFGRTIPVLPRENTDSRRDFRKEDLREDLRDDRRDDRRFDRRPDFRDDRRVDLREDRRDRVGEVPAFPPFAGPPRHLDQPPHHQGPGPGLGPGPGPGHHFDRPPHDRPYERGVDLRGERAPLGPPPIRGFRDRERLGDRGGAGPGPGVPFDRPQGDRMGPGHGPARGLSDRQYVDRFQGGPAPPPHVLRERERDLGPPLPRGIGHGGPRPGSPPHPVGGRGLPPPGPPPGPPAQLPIHRKAKPLMSFKSFMTTQVDDAGPEEFKRRFDVYHVNYVEDFAAAFFDVSKGEEWFRDRYDPVRMAEMEAEGARWAAEESRAIKASLERQPLATLRAMCLDPGARGAGVRDREKERETSEAKGAAEGEEAEDVPVAGRNFAGHEEHRTLYVTGIHSSCTKAAFRASVESALIAAASALITEETEAPPPLPPLPERVLVSQPLLSSKSKFDPHAKAADSKFERSAWVVMPTAADAEAALPVLRQMRVAVLSPHVDPEGKPLVLFTAPVMVSAHQPHPATPAHPQVSSAARVQADTIQALELAAQLDELQGVPPETRLGALVDAEAAPLTVAAMQRPTDRLDLAIAYLRRVHFVAFYGAKQYWNEAHMLAMAPSCTHRAVPFMPAMDDGRHGPMGAFPQPAPPSTPCPHPVGSSAPPQPLVDQPDGAPTDADSGSGSAVEVTEKAPEGEGEGSTVEAAEKAQEGEEEGEGEGNKGEDKVDTKGDDALEAEAEAKAEMDTEEKTGAKAEMDTEVEAGKGEVEGPSTETEKAADPEAEKVHEDAEAPMVDEVVSSRTKRGRDEDEGGAEDLPFKEPALAVEGAPVVVDAPVPAAPVALAPAPTLGSLIERDRDGPRVVRRVYGDRRIDELIAEVRKKVQGRKAVAEGEPWGQWRGSKDERDAKELAAIQDKTFDLCIEEHCKLEGSKARCCYTGCNKLFKGIEFLRKHLRLKHEGFAWELLLADATPYMQARYEAEDMLARPLPPIEIEVQGGVELRTVKEVLDMAQPPRVLAPPLVLAPFPLGAPHLHTPHMGQGAGRVQGRWEGRDRDRERFRGGDRGDRDSPRGGDRERDNRDRAAPVGGRRDREEFERRPPPPTDQVIQTQGPSQSAPATGGGGRPPNPEREFVPPTDNHNRRASSYADVDAPKETVVAIDYGVSILPPTKKRKVSKK